MPSIDRNSPVPYYQQLYELIALRIESGLYPAGNKLPSIRACAKELGVSNTTVEQAYQKLVEEGYAQPRRGSGYTICEIGKPPANVYERFDEEYQSCQEKLLATQASRSQVDEPLFDFAYDAVDATTFPLGTWARTCREVFFEENAAGACLYSDRQGLESLREQIARYLCVEYSLGCTPEQVLVLPSTRDLVSEIVALFNPSDIVFGMEDPGYDEVAIRLGERGYDVRPIPMHPTPPWQSLREHLEGVSVLFTTPACQFPSNRPMPLETRQALVKWAQESNAYIIDDEYGWEFQSGVARMPSLAALDDSGRIVTLGTFSNSFTPAVCLSYAVLPPQLMLTWHEKRGWLHPQVPWQTQAAMANFMRDGHWKSHVRRIRTSTRGKRALVAECLTSVFGTAIEVVEGESSLFFLLQTRDGRREDELIRAAAAAGVKVYPTSQYWRHGAPDSWRYVLMGYAGIPAESIEDGVNALARAWGFI